MTMTQAEWAEIVKSGDWQRIAAGFKTGSPRPVSLAHFEESILIIAKAYHHAFDRINDLEEQLATVRREHEQFAEAVSDEVMRYQGVWRQDHTYQRGTAVTMNGGLWLALDATDTRPGRGDGTWKLVVKSGHAP